jgi:hypothetical protein
MTKLFKELEKIFGSKFHDGMLSSSRRIIIPLSLYKVLVIQEGDTDDHFMCEVFETIKIRGDEKLHLKWNKTNYTMCGIELNPKKVLYWPGYTVNHKIKQSDICEECK